jgi:ribosomal protein S18 acetylase RimI-like enzyme
MEDIRRLGIQDYARIMELWQRSGLPSLKLQGRDSRQTFARQLESGMQTVLGLEKDGQLIGVVVATHDSRKGWINRLTIDPGHRRQGHAHRLLAAAEDALRAQGMRLIAALIEDWNETSLAFFSKEGYRLHDNVHYVSKRDSDEV